MARAPVTFRRAARGDEAALSLVAGAAFLESFADDHPRDAILAHLAECHGAATYAALLADPAIATWIVESPVAAPVGYAVLAPAALPGAGEGDGELKRIYLLAPWQGTGVSQALFAALVEEARERGYRRLLLSVYGPNHRARAFYARAGFVEIGETVFAVGDIPFVDIVMAREL
jgi:GNAT superfamily N-acetyltransferase